VHDIDVVLTDSQIDSLMNVKAFSHLLGDCGMTLFGAPKLTAKFRGRFPRRFDGAPFLLPTQNTGARRVFDQWFATAQVNPKVVAEFDDSALLKVFGQRGLGFFFAPTVIAGEVQRQYDVRAVGRIDEVRECFYAISLDRKLKHPAVMAISEAAKIKLSD
jgi:LysR family transcriptional activator of nhaA